jgi:hypothetical protein
MRGTWGTRRAMRLVVSPVPKGEGPGAPGVICHCAWISADEDVHATAGREAGATILTLQIQAVTVLARNSAPLR